MRCGDHHAGDAAEVSYAEGDHWCRQRPRRDHGLEARTCHDLGGVFGKDVRVASSIETDDHFAAGQAMIKKVGSQRCRCLADDDPVHPIGSRT